MIFGTQIPEDDSPRAGLLDRMSVPWHVALGATATNTFVHNPITELYDAGSLFLTQHPELGGALGGDAYSQTGLPQPEAQFDASAPENQFIDPKTLNEQYGQSLGLTFDQPMRQGAVAIMVRRKQEEIARQANIDRAPGGLAYGIANFGTQLAVSASDPLNLASAFIPVVGEARAAIWAAKYGKFASRFATGAIEGAVGAAAIEPINYAASKYLGDDYTMGDSIMNIALGSVLGGGLHAGFGALSDRLARAHPETREGALRASIANMAEGRPVDIEHVLASDPQWVHQAVDLPTKLEDRPMFFSKAGEEQFYPNDRPSVGANIDMKNPLVESKMTDAKFDEIQAQLIKEGMPEAQAMETIRDMRNDAFAHSGQFIGPEFQRALENLGHDGMIADKSFRGTHAVAFHPPEQVELGRGKGVDVPNPDTATPPPSELSPQAKTEAAAALDRAQTASQGYARNTERSTAVSPDSSVNGDRVIREARGDDLDTEHAEAMAAIDSFEKQGALTAAEAEQARSGKEDIAKAARDGEAARAASRCLLLHP